MVNFRLIFGKETVDLPASAWYHYPRDIWEVSCPPKTDNKEKNQMDMLISVLLFAVGLVLLIKGGDWFVDGATGIAKRFNLPDIVVGATVVSVGTTLPEVMVSTTGALQGSGAMAYGNAIGSIICNTALIAAISIVCNPGPVNVKSMKTPVLFFFGSAAL